MNPEVYRRDLVVLTEGKDDQQALAGLLNRSPSLGIRAVEADFYVHPERGSGILCRAHEFLRPFSRSHAHALVMLDREGPAQGRYAPASRVELEQKIERDLAENGWDDRAAALVIDPELEIWVWSNSPHVEETLGWSGRTPGLRSWLQKEGFLKHGQTKPLRPKEAMESALWIVRRARSSDLYRRLAEKVSLERCTDPAFARLQAILKRWFPAGV